MRVALRTIAVEAHSLHECCNGLIGVLDAYPSAERATTDAVLGAIESRALAREAP